MRRSITLDDANTLGAVVVSSRLDYCNALLYGLSSPTSDDCSGCSKVWPVSSPMNVTPILHDLHWLPVDARVNYKVALLTNKALTTHRPAYIFNLTRLSRPVRTQYNPAITASLTKSKSQECTCSVW
jgi:hypothetical protein